MAGAAQLLQHKPTPEEENARKYMQSVKKAQDKCPSNSKRYLHQVHYVVNDNNETEAFLGWSDDIPAAHVGHAVSTAGSSVALHTIAKELDINNNAATATATATGQDTKLLEEELDQNSAQHPNPNPHVHTQPLTHMQSPHQHKSHHQQSSTTHSDLLFVPHHDFPHHDEKDDHPKEALNITNAFAKGNYLFSEKERTDFTKTKKRSLRRILFMDAKIKRMSDIDTTQETFRAKFHFYLTWLATYDEVQEYLKWEHQAEQRKKVSRKMAPWAPEWEPQIEFTNAIDIHDYDRTCFVFTLY
ncbi:hypothetical protein RFI_39490, partial [Reticulomyxa filosa]